MSDYATYCPEDDKIRLYTGRVAREHFERFRSFGFKSTPKQDCDFVAVWSPCREDLALDYTETDQLEDEDQSPEDRAADRAERFGGYRDKRLGEAVGHADSFDAGPMVHGYQSQARAERSARRHDKQRSRAVSQWSKAEYWQRRTAGVISNALHKSSATVRRGRILKIEKELRDVAKTLAEAQANFDNWQSVLQAEGASEPITLIDDRWVDKAKTGKAGRIAYAMANYKSHGNYEHPRKPGKPNSLMTLLSDPVDPITPAEAAALWLGPDPQRPGGDNSHLSRWNTHLELRLAYEQAMIEAAGGSLTDRELETGGMIGNILICGVNKSPATGRPVSLKVFSRHSWKRGADGDYLQCFVSVNIERMADHSDYAPPTPESLAKVKEHRATVKAAKLAVDGPKGKPVKLINPDEASARGLQAIVNADVSKDIDSGWYTKPGEPLAMKQGTYTANSKGSYCCAGIAYLHASGKLASSNRADWKGYGECLFKFRLYKTNPGKPGPSVIVLSDKPRKPAPLDLLTPEPVEGAPVTA